MPDGYMGIDPSLTAFAMTGEGIPRLIVSTEPDDFPCFSARLEHLVQQCSGHVRAARPKLVAIEGPSFASKGMRGVESGGLHCTIRWMLWRAGVSFLDVPPKVLKKYVAGDGNATKSIMVREVWRKWQYEAVDDNDADAYGLSRLAEAWAVGGDAKWLIQLRTTVRLTPGRGSSALASPSPSQTLPGSSSAPRPARSPSSERPKRGRASRSGEGSSSTDS